ncbi:hypothetical protein CDD83_6346 [Cordyceps sp. RAO-2017]|nr:hypothetical protein CDD83_6346 [Cordyceps sp. RAO-2017]
MAVLELRLAAAAAAPLLASASAFGATRLAPRRLASRRAVHSVSRIRTRTCWQPGTRLKSTSSRESDSSAAATAAASPPSPTGSSSSEGSPSSSSSSSGKRRESAGGKFNLYGDEWEDSVDFAIKSFEELPHRLFGVNQHMIINYELKEALRMMLRQFNAPIVYCFAYGSGVFPQESSSRSISEAEFRAVHPRPPAALVRAQKGAPKMIDFIFGVSYTQHWHSINMRQHRGHYSAVAALGWTAC